MFGIPDNKEISLKELEKYPVIFLSKGRQQGSIMRNFSEKKEWILNLM